MSDELGELLSGLVDSHPSEELHVAAGALLREPLDWPRLVSDRLRRMDAQELRSEYAYGHVADVEPLNIPVWSDPDDRAAAVVGHFDRPRFDRWLRDGRITAHHHRWSFASRMLRGRYLHWWYDNDGSDEQPELRLAEQETHGRGDVFVIDHARFHCVLAPEHDTVTLVVRGTRHARREAAVLRPKDAEDLARRRARVVDLLDALGS
jgi:hypothetical protein